MENDHGYIMARLEMQEKKLDAIFESTERVRKYFLISMWITVILTVLPLLTIIVLIPWFLSTTLGNLEGLL